MQFECDKCGACCSGHLIVEAYELDVLREPRLAEAEIRGAALPLAKELESLGLQASRPELGEIFSKRAKEVEKYLAQHGLKGGKAPEIAVRAAELMAELEQEGRALVIAGGKPCHFLGEDNLCEIYPTRPNTCVAMQAGDRQCQDARKAANLPPLPPVSGR